MVTNTQYTTIRVKKEILNKIANEGKKNESYDAILSRLLRFEGVSAWVFQSFVVVTDQQHMK